MRNEVWQGDCLQLMENIPDQSIDMIFCDLPYGIAPFDWDSKINLKQLWAHYARIIKPGRAIMLTAVQPFTSELILSNPKWYRTEWIWKKNASTGFLNANKQPLRAHENILVFCKTQPMYNPQKILGKPYKSKRKINETAWASKTILADTKNDGTRYPITIQEFSIERGLHSTQKPVTLCEYFIRTYSNEGDLILDNCAGSGSTAVAAKQANRDYLLIEKDPQYIEVISKRLNRSTGD